MEGLSLGISKSRYPYLTILYLPYLQYIPDRFKDPDYRYVAKLQIRSFFGSMFNSGTFISGSRLLLPHAIHGLHVRSRSRSCRDVTPKPPKTLSQSDARHWWQAGVSLALMKSTFTSFGSDIPTLRLVAIVLFIYEMHVVSLTLGHCLRCTHQNGR